MVRRKLSRIRILNSKVVTCVTLSTIINLNMKLRFYLQRMWRLLTQTWTQRSSSVLVASVLLFYLAWFHLISGRFTVTGNRRVRDAHSEQSVFPSDDEIVRAALQYSHTDELTTEVLQRYLLRYNYPVLLTVYMYTFVMNASNLNTHEFRMYPYSILQLRSEQDVQLQSKASIRKPF